MAAPESSDGYGKSSSEIAKREDLDLAKKCQDPPPPPSSDVKLKPAPSFGGVLFLLQIFIALIAGAFLGAYLAAHLLESEYQNIISNLQSDHHSSLLRSQNDHIKCQTHLTREQRSTEEELTILRIHADRNERAFQQRVEQYLNETTMAYKVANEGLAKASSRLKMEADNHETTRLQLSQAISRLKAEEEDNESTRLQLSQSTSRLEEEKANHESTKLQLSQATSRLREEEENHDSTKLQLSQATSRSKEEEENQESTKLQLSQATSRLKEEEENHKFTKLQLSQATSRLKAEEESHEFTQQQLSQATSRLKEEEENHDSTKLQLSHEEKWVEDIRNTLTESTQALEMALIQRNETQKRVLQLQSELDATDEQRDVERAQCDEHHREMLKCHESLKGIADKPVEVRLEAQLAQVLEENEELTKNIRIHVEAQAERNAAIEEIGAMAEELMRQRDIWETIAKSMMEKVTHRSRKEVMEQFGPGPHYVRLTLAFPSSPANESILLELAPLNSMPHTIHMVLSLIQEKMYVSGTFILSRDHIIVAGPVDSHNAENNRELEERMVRKGYFPAGVLLFREYTPDYPHVQYTVGFNQSGGPIFYINMKDNTALHGSHSNEEEGQKEGDPCFAKVVEGFDVVQRIAQMQMVNGSLELPVYIKDTQIVTVTSQHVES